MKMLKTQSWKELTWGLKAMDKKGTISAYVLAFTLTILTLTLPFYFILDGIVKKGIGVSLNTHNLEHYLLLNRIFYSTNAFFYNDPYTGRTNLEEVDFSKFNEDTLENLFGENAKIAMKIVLDDNVLYYNKNLYDFIEQVHAKSEKYGISNKNKLVLVRYPNGMEEKKLLMVNVGFEK